jgi:hypothetical protein
MVPQQQAYDATTAALLSHARFMHGVPDPGATRLLSRVPAGLTSSSSCPAESSSISLQPAAASTKHGRNMVIHMALLARPILPPTLYPSTVFDGPSSQSPHARHTYTSHLLCPCSVPGAASTLTCSLVEPCFISLARSQQYACHHARSDRQLTGQAMSAAAAMAHVACSVQSS